MSEREHCNCLEFNEADTDNHHSRELQSALNAERAVKEKLAVLQAEKKALLEEITMLRQRETDLKALLNDAQCGM